MLRASLCASRRSLTRRLKRRKLKSRKGRSARKDSRQKLPRVKKAKSPTGRDLRRVRTRTERTVLSVPTAQESPKKAETRLLPHRAKAETRAESLQRAKARSSSTTATETSSHASTDARTVLADAATTITISMMKPRWRSRNVIRENTRPRW